MGNYGLKASLDGEDVTVATPEELSVTTQFGVLKTKLGQTPAHFGVSGVAIGTLDANETVELVSVAHGFDYVPAHLALVKYNVGSVERSLPLPMRIGTPVFVWSYCDDTYFKIKVHNYDVAPADCGSDIYNFKYYIFVEDGD